MVLEICAKGDFHLLSKIKEGEFSEAELYLRTSNDCDDKKLLMLPSYLKIASVHQPTYVQQSDKLILLDLTDKRVQEESIEAIKITFDFLKRNNIPKLVLHCSSYDPREEKREIIIELANVVKSFFGQGIEVSFETDMLGFNTYLPRRKLLTTLEDFKLLDHALGGKLLITLDVEHISGTSVFNLVKENIDISKLNREQYYSTYLNFVGSNSSLVVDNFKNKLSSFIEAFRDKISHIHLNGSDFKNYIIDPITTLPLIGEHLPLGYKNGNVQDRLNYSFIIEQFKKLPSNKEIKIVLELGIRKDKYDFHHEMYRSKLFLTRYLNTEERALIKNKEK